MRHLAPVLIALGLSAFAANTHALPNDKVTTAAELPNTLSNSLSVNINGADDDTYVTSGAWLTSFGFPNAIWYKWTAPIGGQVTVGMGAGTFPIFGATFTLSTTPGVDLDTVATDTLNTNGVVNYTYTATAGTTYYTMATDYFGRATSERLGKFRFVHYFVQSALSDSFATRTPLGGRKFTITGNNGSFTSETDEPSHTSGANAGSGKSAWMTWTTPVRSTVTLTTTNSSFDALIAVYTGDELATLTRVAQSRSSSRKSATQGTQYTSTLTFVAEPNVPYQIAVDGSKNRAGGFFFDLQATNTKAGFLVKPISTTVFNGDPVTFSATVASTGETTYQWQVRPFGSKTWTDLADDGNYSGSTTPTLTLQTTNLDLNQYAYRLMVDDDLGPIPSPAAVLTVTEFPQINTEIRGTATLDLSATSLVNSLEGVTFFATNLPKGLTLDPSTGMISGVITGKAGVYRVVYGTIKDGKRGAETRVVIINVDAFAPQLNGAFEALPLNADGFPMGKLALRVTATGTYTGTYYHNATSRSYGLKGILELDQNSRTAGTPIGSPTILTLARDTTIKLEFVLTEPEQSNPDALASLAVYVNDSNDVFLGETLNGGPVSRFTATNPAPWTNVYTARLTGIAQTTPDPAIAYPVGSGYATAAISKPAGTLSMRGRLPDNTPFTASLASSPSGRYLVAQRVHAAAGGSLGGSIILDQQLASDLLTVKYAAVDSSNTLYWVKPASPKDKLYPAGFGTSPLRFNFLMQPWTNPGAQVPSSFGLAPAGSMVVNIVAAVPQDSNDALTTRFNLYGLPIDVNLGATGAIAAFVDPATNPTKFSFRLDRGSGSFSGGYELAEPIVPPATRAVVRKVTFSGVMFQTPFPARGDVMGEGFTISPAPVGSTEATSSGLIDFRTGELASPFGLETLP